MKLHITTPEPTLPQITAQGLSTGQAVRYPAGNGVFRLSHDVYISFDTDGKVLGMYSTARDLGHGQGDLLPRGTLIAFAL